MCLEEIAIPSGLPWPLWKPARSISQAAEVLTRPSSSGKRGGRSGARCSSAANASADEDRVGEERAGGDRVGVVRVEHHALAAAQAEHRLAHVGERRALAGLHAERARELGVGERARQLAALERERDREHDPAPGVALERARAVGEAAVGGRELGDLAGRAVERAHGRDRLGDLLAVGADVLDRRRADRAGDARQALDAREPLGDAARHERLPLLPRGDGQLDAPVALALLDAAREHAHDRARPALVGDHEVRAAGDEQHVVALRRLDELRLAARLDDRAGGPAEAQGGELAQPRHGPRD